jgi:hypothetical protein
MVPPDIIAKLELREGLRPYIYNDSREPPNLTGGYGHKITASEKAAYPLNTTVTPDIADAWLQNDSLSAYHAAIGQAGLIGVDDPRLIAGLTCVCYQLGNLWYKKFPHTWQLLLQKRWDAAALEAQNSLWYQETPTRVEDFQAALRSLNTPETAPLNNGGETA